MPLLCCKVSRGPLQTRSEWTNLCRHLAWLHAVTHFSRSWLWTETIFEHMHHLHVRGCFTARYGIDFKHLLRPRRLLVDCNQLAVDIDNELVVVHNWVRSKSLHSLGADRMAACNVVTTSCTVSSGNRLSGTNSVRAHSHKVLGVGA